MIASFVFIAVMVTLSNYFIDTHVALLISKTFYRNPLWSTYTSAIPDTLFMAVCVITTVAVCCYFYRTSKGVRDAATSFCLLMAVAVPTSFIIKSALKLLFGRINTRVWLHRPELYGFHWFHGGSSYDGFPSGHMMVFTTFIAVLWRFHPRYRSAYLVFMLMLAGALIATNYHFFSDVLAGAYLGIVVEAITCKALNRPSIGMVEN